jgi:RIO kinase 1
MRETAEAHGVILDVSLVNNFRYAFSQTKNGSPDLVDRIFRTCQIAHVWRCHTVENGRFYRCPPSVFIPEAEGDPAALTGRDGLLISDVLGQVKGGKEASVYRCEGHPATGQALLAAKVYRPRQFRNLRNDAMYRQGREVLKGDGRAVKKTDQRIARAVGKKSAFGVQVQHTSWLMYEYTTLERLHTAGAAVPKPWGVNDNAIMMEYIGDEYEAGPALNEVRLDPDEVEPLFRETLRNIELMLNMNLIHGDLSAYNILYWDGKITLIDFPQVSNSRANDKARFILGRDITRVCQYFSGQGLDCDAEAILNDMWQRNVAVGPDEVAAEESLHLMDADYWLADDEEDD